MAKFGSAFLCERHGKVYLCKPSPTFRFVYALVAPLASTKTLDNVFILDSVEEMRAKISEEIDLKHVPKEFGGADGSKLAMAVIREHLAHKGLGLHNDLQNESSIVGNFPQVLMFRDFGTPAQADEFINGMLKGTHRICFGLTEPEHGSDATWMETKGVRETRDGVDGWVLNGEKIWTTGMHVASHVMLFARTSGDDGAAKGITCFLVPADDKGVKIEEYMWTFNMPTDNPRVSFTDIWVPDSAIFGEPENGLALAQHFVHENRIRQAASGVGATQYCIDQSVAYAKQRAPFGKPLSTNQAIQFPLTELHTECEMIRNLVYKTAAQMDEMSKPDVAIYLSDKVSMCNYRANRLVCEAADRAIQVHGGIGFTWEANPQFHYRRSKLLALSLGSASRWKDRLVSELEKSNVA